MTRIPKMAVALALIMLPALVAESRGSTIVYGAWSANQIRVMVMDESGANPTEVYRYPKFSIGGSWSISPPGPDGTWIAIEDSDLYKVRADGTEPTKILCYEGTDVEGQPYNLLGQPQWSPDGTEILVQTWNSLALIPADFTAGPDCPTTPLTPIFHYEWDEDGWSLVGTAAWNDDGTQIAFFEYLYPGELYGDLRLVILGLVGTTWNVVRTVDATHVELFDGSPGQLDWQRNGDLLLFNTKETLGPHQFAWWLNWIHAETGDWGYLQEGATRLEGTSPSWSPDGARLVFTNSGGDLVKWDYPSGPGEVLGSGTQPDWQRDALPSGCESDDDCLDGNPCTDDWCDQTSGQCNHDPNFEPCDDGKECTWSDACDAGVCEGTPVSDGEDCSSGYCCGGLCEAPKCLVDSDCDDGDFCTLDVCDWQGPCAVACEHSPNPDPACQCLPKDYPCTSDDECCSEQCHPVKGTCK